MQLRLSTRNSRKEKNRSTVQSVVGRKKGKKTSGVTETPKDNSAVQTNAYEPISKGQTNSLKDKQRKQSTTKKNTTSEISNTADEKCNSKIDHENVGISKLFSVIPTPNMSSHPVGENQKRKLRTRKSTPSVNCSKNTSNFDKQINSSSKTTINLRSRKQLLIYNSADGIDLELSIVKHKKKTAMQTLVNKSKDKSAGFMSSDSPIVKNKYKKPANPLTLKSFDDITVINDPIMDVIQKHRKEKTERLKGNSSKRKRGKTLTSNMNISSENTSTANEKHTRNYKMKASLGLENTGLTPNVFPVTSTPYKSSRQVYTTIIGGNRRQNLRSSKNTLSDSNSATKSDNHVYSPSLRNNLNLRCQKRALISKPTNSVDLELSVLKLKCKKKSVMQTPAIPLKFKSFGGMTVLNDPIMTAIQRNRKAKSEGFKVPCKNTLKRKRFISEELKKCDENHEDDLFENQNFDQYQKYLADITVDSNKSYDIATPKPAFSLTPVPCHSTPKFKDTLLSPTELAVNRKLAEECMFRRNKWKKKSLEASDVSSKKDDPEKKKLEFSHVLKKAFRKEQQIEQMMNETSVLDDSYFSFC